MIGAEIIIRNQMSGNTRVFFGTEKKTKMDISRIRCQLALISGLFLRNLRIFFLRVLKEYGSP